MIEIKVNENKITKQKTITLNNTISSIVGLTGGSILVAEVVKKGKIVLTLKKGE